MTDTLRPPPYRKRRPEADDPAGKTPEQQDLALRDELIRVIGGIAAIGVLAGLVLLLRELPGGSLPYPLPLPSLVYWLGALVLAALAMGGRRSRRRNMKLLVIVLLGLAAGSILGMLLTPTFFLDLFR